MKLEKRLRTLGIGEKKFDRGLGAYAIKVDSPPTTLQEEERAMHFRNVAKALVKDAIKSEYSLHVVLEGDPNDLDLLNKEAESLYDDAKIDEDTDYFPNNRQIIIGVGALGGLDGLMGAHPHATELANNVAASFDSAYLKELSQSTVSIGGDLLGVGIGFSIAALTAYAVCSLLDKVFEPEKGKSQLYYNLCDSIKKKNQRNSVE